MCEKTQTMISKKKNYKNFEIFYKVNVKYSITINLDDQHQGRKMGKAFTRLVLCKKYVQEILDRYNEYIDYVLYLDISEPKEMKFNKKPRVHFHGLIRFSDAKGILDWLIMVSPKLSEIAYINIDTYDGDQYYEKYCKKYCGIINICPIQSTMCFGPDDKEIKDDNKIKQKIFPYSLPV